MIFGQRPWRRQTGKVGVLIICSRASVATCIIATTFLQQKHRDKGMLVNVKCGATLRPCYLLHGICVPPPPPPDSSTGAGKRQLVPLSLYGRGKARNDLGIHPGNRAHRSWRHRSCELTLYRRGGGGGLITPRPLLRFFRNNS